MSDPPIKIKILSDGKALETKEIKLFNLKNIGKFDTEDFYTFLIKLLLGSIIHNNNIYWIKNLKWKQIEYSDAVEFMRSKFKQYLLNIKYTEDLTGDENIMIDRIIKQWKSNLNSEIIFNKIMSSFEVNKDFLSKNNIYTINTITEEKIISKTLQDYSIIFKDFYKKICIITENSEDRISTTQLYKIFVDWCHKNQASICDIRIFGRILKIYNIESIKKSLGNEIIGIKINPDN